MLKSEEVPGMSAKGLTSIVKTLNPKPGENLHNVYRIYRAQFLDTGKTDMTLAVNMLTQIAKDPDISFIEALSLHRDFITR